MGITGDEYKNINLITKIPKIYQLIQYIKLFCRISQKQKEQIIKDLIKCGKNPSMCGDGSNDTGALKYATIGVVLLNVKGNKIQKKESLNFISWDVFHSLSPSSVFFILSFFFFLSLSFFLLYLC